ncbi:DUF2917 domain-containing protein [Pseudobdellovibrio exovorus]|uniref:DUF2917 domain-containing protein n=1 Tax=Pseudobdellovibrio exovorus JSS TaxID=1184267 RepID=M4VF78_9BACT|nr:DUF2917 domain-containing protein [Pseudobdellovibrio exovorus]AGH96706.1 hypothetical protein A11Q_2490 [Pseudobdellovibrio exovorus JSS]
MNKVKLFHISLNKGEKAKLPAALADKLFIECQQGAAWLTVARDPQDYIVEQNQEIQLSPKRQEVLVESMTDRLEVDIYACA